MWESKRSGILATAIALIIVASAFVFVITPSSTLTVGGAPIWSSIGGNESRTGRSNLTINSNFSNVDWSLPRGYADSLVVAGDGSILLLGPNGNQIIAVNPDNGASRSKTIEGSCTGPITIGPDGTILLLESFSYANHLTALYPSGDVKWMYNLSQDFDLDPQIIVRSPSVSQDGTIYLIFDGQISQGNFTSFLLAIDSSGRKIWQVTLPHSCESSPTITKDGVLLSLQGGFVCDYFFNGTPNWTSRPILDREIGPFFSVDSDGTIFTSAFTDNYDRSPEVVSLYPNGTLKWRCLVGPQAELYTFGGLHYPLSTLPNGTVIAVVSALSYKIDLNDSGSYGMPSKVFAISPNGSILWENFLYDSLYYYDPTPPIVDNEGHILICSGTSLYEFDQDGSIVQRFDSTNGDTVHSAVIGKNGQVFSLLMKFNGGYELIAFGNS